MYFYVTKCLKTRYLSSYVNPDYLLSAKQRRDDTWSMRHSYQNHEAQTIKGNRQLEKQLGSACAT